MKLGAIRFIRYLQDGGTVAHQLQKKFVDSLVCGAGRILTVHPQ